MNKHPIFQNQHRIPKVYLKHFGDNKIISVYQKFRSHTQNLFIDKFSSEINIFDLPFDDFDLKGYFELKTAQIENDYPKVVKSISNQKKLIQKHKKTLVKFIASLICKSVSHQNFFKGLIDDENCRNKFIQEVLMFCEKEDVHHYFGNQYFDRKNNFNTFLCLLFEHLTIVLQNFNFVILRDFDDRGWFTSENPVLIDKQNRFDWIVPLESEIYFPISRDFCLFLFHNSSEIKTNLLRSFLVNQINLTDENLHKNISNKLASNDNEFIIFPVLIENISLDEIE